MYFSEVINANVFFKAEMELDQVAKQDLKFFKDEGSTAALESRARSANSV